MTRGQVVGIFIAPTAGAPLEAVASAEAIAGVGLAGDRYAHGRGTYSDRPGGGRHLTLVAAEDLEALARETGMTLDPAQARRNLLTRGVDLRRLVGRRFRIGAVVCVGVRPCHPCAYLESKTQPGVLQGLTGRGGLRAEIVSGGTIGVGAAIEALDGAE